MATRRTRAYRDGSRRTAGSGALLDTVRNTFGQLTGKRRGSARGGGLASQASGFIGGLLSGGDNRRGSGRAGRARRRR
jgi:hypothetical protein